MEKKKENIKIRIFQIFCLMFLAGCSVVLSTSCNQNDQAIKENNHAPKILVNEITGDSLIMIDMGRDVYEEMVEMLNNYYRISEMSEIVLSDSIYDILSKNSRENLTSELDSIRSHFSKRKEEFIVNYGNLFLYLKERDIYGLKLELLLMQAQEILLELDYWKISGHLNEINKKNRFV